VATPPPADPDCFFCNDSTLHGGFGEVGGQAGYNWQFGHAVVGVEGDLNWQSFNRTTGTIATVEVTNTKLDAFASVRLRAGLAVDHALAYVTFGPAWAHANSISTQFTDASLTTIAEQAIDKGWHGGIATGAGIEYMLAPNWAVRGEYLYVDYTDAVNFLVPTTQGRKDYGYSEQIARVGLDYLFNGGTTLGTVSSAPILGKAHMASVPAAAPSWNGFYVGGNAGGGIAEGQILAPDSFFFAENVDHRGFASLGGQAGYDAQWNAMVVGVLGDVDWTNAKRSGPVALSQFLLGNRGGTNQFQMDALASLRARIGLAADRSLFYVTAGPALGYFNSQTTIFTTPALTTIRDTASDNTWHLGLAAGAGIEYALDPHWSVFGEYLYYDFSSKTAFFQPTAVGAAIDAQKRTDYAGSAQVARVGVNYSFAGHGSGTTGTSQYSNRSRPADWAGFYLGANAGGGLVNGNAIDVDCFTCSDMNFHTAFAAIGGQGGFNWQWGTTVLGLEADADWTSASTSRALGLDNSGAFGPAAAHYKMDAFASLRARAGLAIDRSLLYLTAGPAIGHFNENAVALDGSFAFPWNGWTLGLAAGAGFAYRLDPHWSLRAEFLHLAFADHSANCVPRTAIAAQLGCGPLTHMQYANSSEVARVGIDYAFDWGASGKAPPPLVSKN
jgi:opacity protein-like surface antigen